MNKDLKKEIATLKALNERYFTTIRAAAAILGPYLDLEHLITMAATSNDWEETVEYLDKIDTWLNNYCEKTKGNATL